MLSSVIEAQKPSITCYLENMSSPPDYDAENMPLIADISDNDDPQMCKQLLRWLDENNLGNQDLISISALRDGLIKTASKASKASKTSNFGHDKVHPTTRLRHPVYIHVLTSKVYL